MRRSIINAIHHQSRINYLKLATDDNSSHDQYVVFLLYVLTYSIAVEYVHCTYCSITLLNWLLIMNPFYSNLILLCSDHILALSSLLTILLYELG